MKPFSRSLGAIALIAVNASFSSPALAEAICAECATRAREVTATAFQSSVERLAAAVPAEIPACTDRTINLRTVHFGFKCETSFGRVFERVELFSGMRRGWKGPDGLIWFAVGGTYSYMDAIRECRWAGGHLPSEAEFMRGNWYGFHEALPFMTAGSVFWAYSPGSENVAHTLAPVFNPYTGSTGSELKGIEANLTCVVRPTRAHGTWR